MTNEQVQRVLAGVGLYKGEIDGDFGPLSKKALETFQGREKLPPTRKLDAATIAALKAHQPKPGAWTLDATSEKNLKGVHSDLVEVVRRAAKLSPVPFRVTEGVRTLARQRKLVADGFSKTMNSRHLAKGKPPVSHAVDISPMIGGKVRFDWPPYYPLAVIMKQAARDVNVPIEWGGDWKGFPDGPHWQLPWGKYPV